MFLETLVSKYYVYYYILFYNNEIKQNFSHYILNLNRINANNIDDVQVIQ